MDLEVVGRHALFFDDDSMAAFVNSGDALVEWNSLQIDRYDVRHLLSSPPPPRKRSNYSSSQLVDSALESELDQERYFDLPPPSNFDESEVEGEKPVDAGGYNAVGFSYGNVDDTSIRKSSEVGMESSQFRPSFPVPENLLNILPPTEKVHQIIARTALFVSKHGGQSEIVLRVKQGDNPAFGFLMPDHDLHAYFRFLVDHPELVQSDSDVKPQTQGEGAFNEHKVQDGVGGALSLLGSVYGSGEDEEAASAYAPGSEVSTEVLDASDAIVSRPLERVESSSNAREKEETVSIQSLHSGKDKEKSPIAKKNNLVNASKIRNRSSIRKEDEVDLAAALEKAKALMSIQGTMPKTGTSIVEPPSDLKRLIDKIVEFIVKNGKQFESTLMEQDNKHGRFPFLLPSNQYHPYYLRVLQKSQESKIRGQEKKASLFGESYSLPLESAGYDLPFECDKKEKFTMVIGKSKKVTEDPPSRTSQQEVGVGVDAAAAAAILWAATRGIKNPNLGVTSSSNTNGNSQGHSSEGGKASNFVHVSSSAHMGQKSEHNTVAAKAKAIAKCAASEAASEADSSEAHLSKEQKLKAERLRRAKMFVALLKNEAAPVKTGSSCGGSVEPRDSALSDFGTAVNVAKEREGTLCPLNVAAKERGGSPSALYVNLSNENEKHEKELITNEYERRSRRKYRSRSGRHEEEEEEEEEDEEEQHSRKKHRSSREDEKGRDKKRSKKKRRGGRSSHKDDVSADEDEEDQDSKHSRKKHRSADKDEEDQEDKHSRKKHRSADKDQDDKHSRKKHRSQHSSHEYNDDERRDTERYEKHGRKKRSSHLSSRENGIGDEEGDKHSKKYRSHRSSHHSREKRGHRKRHSSSDDESTHEHVYENSSNDVKQQEQRADKHGREMKEREEPEEGEIITKVSDQSTVSREASVDVSSSQQRATPSQPSQSTEVSDDLRAKIRAMLLATRN